jgi:hypothetical protein
MSSRSLGRYALQRNYLSPRIDSAAATPLMLHGGREVYSDTGISNMYDRKGRYSLALTRSQTCILFQISGTDRISAGLVGI